MRFALQSIMESCISPTSERVRVLYDGEDAGPIKVIPRMAISIDLAIADENVTGRCLIGSATRHITTPDLVTATASVSCPRGRWWTIHRIGSADWFQLPRRIRTRQDRGDAARLDCVLRRFRSFSVGVLTTEGANGDR